LFLFFPFFFFWSVTTVRCATRFQYSLLPFLTVSVHCLPLFYSHCQPRPFIFYVFFLYFLIPCHVFVAVSFDIP
jgi:hypothetical protein